MTSDTRPDTDQRRHQPADALVANSVAGSFWTGVSRATGLVRAAIIGAALGATYLGNTYQALNSLPNLVYYQLLAGSLFASVLVPVLVRHLEGGDAQRARDVLNGFLGILLVFAAIGAVGLALGGHVLIDVMGTSVSGSTLAARQTHVGTILLLLFLPQIVFYLIAGVGTATMNSHRRFALAAAAPAVENIGIIAVMIAAVVCFRSTSDIGTISDAEVIFLGVGTTLAVAMHAALQWWGAKRCGVPMVPRWGWKDSEARLVARRLVPALGYSGLVSVQLLATLLVANRVVGGVVAFQLALNFYFLPIALVAWPVARALLPELSSASSSGGVEFRDNLRRALRLASFAVIPLAIAYMAFAEPIAKVVSFGKLDGDGAHLIAVSLLTLAPGVIAETWFILGTSASYAREDVTTPLIPMALRVGISLAVMAGVVVVHGTATLPLLGISMSLGSLAGALYLARRVRQQCEEDTPAGSDLAVFARALPRSIVRTTAIAVLALLPAWAASTFVHGFVAGRLGNVAALLIGGTVFGALFLGVNHQRGADELAMLRARVPRRGADGGRTECDNSGPSRSTAALDAEAAT